MASDGIEPPTPRFQTSNRNGSLALIGVLLIFGGEAFCLLGPLRFERVVHIACHAMFYTGIAIAAFGAFRAYRAGR